MNHHADTCRVRLVFVSLVYCSFAVDLFTISTELQCIVCNSTACIPRCVYVCMYAYEQHVLTNLYSKRSTPESCVWLHASY